MIRNVVMCFFFLRNAIQFPNMSVISGCQVSHSTKKSDKIQSTEAANETVIRYLITLKRQSETLSKTFDAPLATLKVSLVLCESVAVQSFVLCGSDDDALMTRCSGGAAAVGLASYLPVVLWRCRDKVRTVSG